MTRSRLRLSNEALSALSSGAVAFASAAVLVAIPVPHVHVVVVGALYILVVLLVAHYCGIAYAIPVGVASVVALDWYHLPPTHSSGIPDAQDAVTLATNLISGVALGQLAARARHRAIASEGARSALADEHAALRRVATMVAGEPPPAEVFASVTQELVSLLGADVTCMLRYEPDGSASVVASSSMSGAVSIPVGTRFSVAGDNVAAMVFRDRRPARVDSFVHATGPLASFLRSIGIHSSAGSPIVVEGRLWGVMVAGTVRQERLPERTESRIGEFTELVATAISNAEARTELRAARARLVAAGDDTRRRLERNLHDGAQQRLVSLALHIQAIEVCTPGGASELRAQLSRIRDELGGVLDDLREIPHGMYPSILTQGGLRPALKVLARSSAVPVELTLAHVDRLPEQVEVATYYVVSEAHANAAKYAKATVVYVDVDTASQLALISIRDNGVGGADFSQGSGLVGLRDRVEALGGSIEM
jgi:signal transduction histidine kinase